MSFLLYYNASDSQTIQDSYQATRTLLAAADRQNIDACWNAGLSTWNTTAVRAYTAATNTWADACYRPLPRTGASVLDNGLCDQDTRLIVVNGIWAANASAYGAVRNATITKAGFVGLLTRMGQTDPDPARGRYIQSLAADIAATAVEPAP